MFRYAILTSCILLAGCGTTQILDQQYVVAKPSAAMYQCNIVDLPDPKGLTDRQIARTIVALVKANRQCYNSLKTIHAFEENTDGTIHVPQRTITKVRQVTR